MILLTLVEQMLAEMSNDPYIVNVFVLERKTWPTLDSICLCTCLFLQRKDTLLLFAVSPLK